MLTFFRNQNDNTLQLILKDRTCSMVFNQHPQHGLFLMKHEVIWAVWVSNLEWLVGHSRGRFGKSPWVRGNIRGVWRIWRCQHDDFIAFSYVFVFCFFILTLVWIREAGCMWWLPQNRFWFTVVVFFSIVICFVHTFCLDCCVRAYFVIIDNICWNSGTA